MKRLAKVLLIALGLFLIAEILPWVLVQVRNGREEAAFPRTVVASEARERLREAIVQLQGLQNRATLVRQREAAEWIAGAFRSGGTQAEVQTTTDSAEPWPVVTARCTGTARPGELILLLAHLDSIADNPNGIAPGADDNATGVAVLLEVARKAALSAHDRTILFCVFPNEERGLTGSRWLASKMRREAADIKAIINVDVVGYNRPSRPVYFDAVFAHETFRHQAKALWRMQENYFRGAIWGRDIIKVAGRPEDAALVARVAERMPRSEGLGIQAITDPGCG